MSTLTAKLRRRYLEHLDDLERNASTEAELERVRDLRAALRPPTGWQFDWLDEEYEP